jgi:hypothetical protein
MEALQRLHNRGSVSTGYNIDNSCKFEDTNDEYFTRTNASGTNRRTWTVSLWCKRTELSTADGLTMELWDGGVYGEATRIGFGLNNDEIWYDIGYSTKFRGQTTRQYTDTAAWYHIVWKVDTTQATEADRMRLYVNGEEVTEWVSRQYPTQNYDSAVHAGTLARIGSYNTTYHGFRGYIAEFNYLDGLAVAPTEFGEFDEDTGIWKPKEYTGSYPGQSCYLDFSNSANLGSNAKGDDADWTANNIAAADQATDTPTNNFCMLNPVASTGTSAITEGGTYFKNSATSWCTSVANMGVASGKWYFEAKRLGSENTFIGICNDSYNRVGETSADGDNGIGLLSNGRLYGSNGASGYVTTAPAFTFTANDIISIAIDMDNRKFYIAKNGTFQNSANPATGAGSVGITTASGFFLPYISAYGEGELQLNFGGFDGFTVSSGNADANGYGNFEYAVPSGYYAICTKNLEEYG